MVMLPQARRGAAGATPKECCMEPFADTAGDQNPVLVESIDVLEQNRRA
jgi:hypothetical protein